MILVTEISSSFGGLFHLPTVTGRHHSTGIGSLLSFCSVGGMLPVVTFGGVEVDFAVVGLYLTSLFAGGCEITCCGWLELAYIVFDAFERI